MKQQDFERKYQSLWQTFEKNVSQSNKNLPNIDQFSKNYRAICQHLALAQERLYNDHLISYLNRLSLLGHEKLYRQSSSLTRRIGQFLVADFPVTLRQEWRLFLLASLLLYLPMLIMGLVIYFNPDFAFNLFTVEDIFKYKDMYDPANDRFGRERSADSDFYMFGFYIINNIGIDFRCFATGIVFGLGSMFFMVFNGIHIGGIAGVLTETGFTDTFYSFVVGHSSFELTAAAISGAAGLKMGFSLLAPGSLRRIDALKKSTGIAIKLLYGAATMTLIAAFIEAYWSSMQMIPSTIKYLVGGILWVMVYAYLFFGGRRSA